ncbi:MAG: hypothetical protein GY816_11795 [Cytophagales bacterium]|nr:hypothetical protein [Cytophagales bacterium]
MDSTYGINQNEVFGSMVTIISFTTKKEAVNEENSTGYGFSYYYLLVGQPT